MSTEESRAVIHRWYDEMWSKKNTDLIPELVGPEYTRHEIHAGTNGKRVVTAEEYREQSAAFCADWTITDMRYNLTAEDDRVSVIGTWKINGQQMDWVQCFRIENGKIVETWVGGLGLDSQWDDATFENLPSTRCAE